MKKAKLVSEDLDQTLKIASKIAVHLNGAEIIELVGDVGSGKTTFVRGLVDALGSGDPVSSPTFTIENIYSGRHTFYHFDFYRMDEAGILEFDLAEKIGKGIIIIEWSGVVKNILPKNRMSISIDVLPSDHRLIKVAVPDSMEYILEGIE